MKEIGLSKYPSVIEADYRGSNFKEGDVIEVTDPNLGINGIYKVIKIKHVSELATVRLKFVKVGNNTIWQIRKNNYKIIIWTKRQLNIWRLL